MKTKKNMDKAREDELKGVKLFAGKVIIEDILRTKEIIEFFKEKFPITYKDFKKTSSDADIFTYLYEVSGVISKK